MKTAIDYVSVKEARNRLYSSVTFSPRVEAVPFEDAHRRVLAEDIVSELNIPAADMAHHDGYAVRSADTTHASPTNPVVLKIAGEVTLGVKPAATLKAGEAWRIPTGGFLPSHSDAVIMKEAVEVSKDGAILLNSPVRVGESLVPKALDVRSGNVLLKRGEEVRAQDVSLLGSLRRLRVRVARRPVVAILSIGNELVNNVEELTDDKTMASHANMVSALIEETGCTPLPLGIVSDEPREIGERIKNALDRADALLTIGGSSVGSRDYVPQVADSLGKPGMLFRGLKIHPGRMGGAGVVNGKPIIILPGLIQSAVIVYFTVAYPLLKRMLGVGVHGDGALCGVRLEKAV
ncbi:MAG: molybdopterin molybdotransferase MoeA, partial [Candidatus Bathyarchaeia archaeon]